MYKKLRMELTQLKRVVYELPKNTKEDLIDRKKLRERMQKLEKKLNR